MPPATLEKEQGAEVPGETTPSKGKGGKNKKQGFFFSFFSIAFQKLLLVMHAMEEGAHCKETCDSKLYDCPTILQKSQETITIPPLDKCI